MSTLSFKTNINCGRCIANVTPSLNTVSGILRWQVDITNPDRVLTVETDSLTAGDIVKVVEKAGYRAEPLS